MKALFSLEGLTVACRFNLEFGNPVNGSAQMIRRITSRARLFLEACIVDVRNHVPECTVPYLDLVIFQRPSLRMNRKPAIDTSL